MKSLAVKHGGLKFWTLFSVVLAASTVAFAGDAPVDADKKEVLTTLELQMQKTISIEASDLPIDQVIRQLAEQADIDVVISPKVTGNVNVGPLTDVPLAEALKNILSTHGYDYVVDKNMVRIVPASEVTQVAEKLVSRIYRITYADVTEVEKALTKFISKQGSLSSNPGTSNVMVTDTESKIKAIDTFIEEIDRITPQILVEARIYDITSKDRLDLGVEWEAGTNTTYDPVDGQPIAGNRDPFIGSGFAGTTSNAESTVAAIRFGWLNQDIDLDFMLRAQQENIDAKLLANPRVLVLDNEKANFKIISEIPYQELTESGMGGAIGTTAFREVGVELQVTPHLTREEMIRLRLSPKFSVVTGTVQVAGIVGTIPQPIVDRREADTTLLVKDGQTVVLGGLRKREATKQINKIPLLGDIPLVGLLFRFEGEDTVTSELVVFITPRIVERPIMSETERKQFETTEFPGPEPVATGAETR